MRAAKISVQYRQSYLGANFGTSSFADHYLAYRQLDWDLAGTQLTEHVPDLVYQDSSLDRFFVSNNPP